MNHVWLPWIRDLARHPDIVSAVTEAFGSKDAYLYNTQLLARLPGEDLQKAMGLNWHKDADNEFSRLEPINRRRFLTAFVALSPCDRLHGCLRARPTNLDGEVGTQEVDLELLPGEFSLHGPSTLHTGGLNTSGETRYGIALRYVSAEVRDRYAGDLCRDTALHVSGAAHEELFDSMPEIPGEATEAGKLLREELIQRRTRGLPCCW